MHAKEPAKAIGATHPPQRGARHRHRRTSSQGVALHVVLQRTSDNLNGSRAKSYYINLPKNTHYVRIALLIGYERVDWRLTTGGTQDLSAKHRRSTTDCLLMERKEPLNQDQGKQEVMPGYITREGNCDILSYTFGLSDGSGACRLPKMLRNLGFGFSDDSWGVAACSGA